MHKLIDAFRLTNPHTRTIAPHMNSIISTIPSLPGVDSEQLHARDLGGGRTLRILTSNQCPNVVDSLLELGCHVESGSARILGVCVPADAPYDSIVLQLAEYSLSR
ncbi:DUF4265 domain-containing protein [Corynebacterium belfantii]|nr:DUF4265 domain-containing protein [Corynebacterium belfantii]MBG9325913.1 DUF4265 domain-containing protein [Corynebacterium belfantii]MBG9329122.1 DUF4265 domain-containing protein [Corynebacterium belfantii]MBG9334260.1 DUF4265 domain-containing protein [Corynebacterium belfantii]MBG9349826.1 DUF4265 domain-containing protein [Corynebacterium belfantii]